VLRDALRLDGTRFGCGLGQCGACTVHLNGAPTRSCVYPISGVGSQHVTTIEGLSDAPAIANAIFAQTGARLRSVPFIPRRVKAALA
jgi:aerobic-type carbon monoxide dehydrogenase small subunit (CoxS/CutS family)